MEDIFVFPSCGDESNSIGAAYWVYAEKCRELGKVVDIPPLREIYFGPSFTDEDATLSKRGTNFSYEHIDNIEKRIAELIAQGEIVARCRGRMEFGEEHLVTGLS